ncbi:hypothetical protein [Halocatena salina]|uniref:Uncharacterized protein n=1 Tax=Halocatena salina TaxID=2934340 RepID=A0A8U0A8V1_9EURY|nr:hypothetical protein [Halocatena salina]UPM45256.1 hypothetical protein MW046_19105 [Halocatena salina]
MTNPIKEEIAGELHAVSFGEAISCDYHHRPKEISFDGSVLVESIRLIDHPQLQLEEWPDSWQLNAVRCSDHSMEEIALPTKGFEETLVSPPVKETNTVMSVDAPENADVQVLPTHPRLKVQSRCCSISS